MRASRLRSLTVLLLTMTNVIVMTTPALSAMGGGESRQGSLGNENYDAGVDAFDRKDWPGVIEQMSQVITRRPWHDNAHNLMGFAYRKLGDYDRSLASYTRALSLNPHNRAALEYLGEAYLDLNQPERAEEILGRLELECKRIAIGISGDGGSASQHHSVGETKFDDQARKGKTLPL